MSRKKILFIYTDMILGGSTTSLLALLFELDKSKYDIDLLLYRNNGVLSDEIPSGIRLLPEARINADNFLDRVKKSVKFFFHGDIFKAIKNEWKYNRKLGLSIQTLSNAQAMHNSRCVENQYDIAIAYLEGWPTDYLVTDKIHAKRKISWIHIDYQNSYYETYLALDIYSKPDVVVSVSDDCEKKNRSCLRLRHSIYLPNIVSEKHIIFMAQAKPNDDEYFSMWENYAQTKLITVCRINNVHKGVDRIIEAATFLKKKDVEFLWYIIGDGPDRENLISEIKSKSLEHNVYMIGSRHNPLPYVRKADVFVLPSRYEGKPIAVTESMILGIPPLVTEYLSAKEQIVNGYDGVIIPNTDGVLGRGIYELLTNKQLLQSIKLNLRSSSYGNSEDVKLYDELFDRLSNEENFD